MAITKGAKKAHRSSLRKRVFNVRRKSELTDVVKKVKKHIASGAVKEAQALMSSAYKAIDKAAKRGVIKPNTAARKKSRLMGELKRRGASGK
jgi:small subunit ribosomal protein S20